MVMPEVSDKVLAKAKEELVKMSSTWAGGVSRGRAWNLQGKRLVEDHSACHSWVSSAYAATNPYVRDKRGCTYYAWDRPYSEDAADFLILSAHSKKRSNGVCSVEAHEAIIKWLASDECSLSKFILNRDDEDSLLNGGVAILCGPNGASQAECMWICKVLRYGVEGAKALDVWLELVNGGVNPYLALYVCTFVRTVQGVTFSYSGLYGHVAVFSRASDDKLSDLLQGKSQGNVDQTANVFCQTIAEGGYNKGNDTRFQDFCKPFKKPDGWGGFVEGVGADRNDFVSRVLEWQAALEKKGGGTKSAAKKVKMPDKNTVFPDVDL